MCRWGCTTTNTTYMCKWCGTRYCRECLRGEFQGLMIESTQCRICNQKKCQGNRIEYVARPKDDVDPKAIKKRSSTARPRSTKSTGSAKSSRSVKSAKSTRAKSGKKSGKKKKKK